MLGYEGVPNFLDALGDMIVDRLNGSSNVAEQTSIPPAGQHQKLQRPARPGNVASGKLTGIGGEASD